GNNAFDDTAGTLIVSNGAIVVVNIGANQVQNKGTIQLTAASGQTSQLNYGTSTGGAFLNSGTGTIIKNDVGTGAFVGNLSGNNVAFQNNGTIFVNAGVLKIDPRDAFNIGGFSNTASGQIFIS